MLQSHVLVLHEHHELGFGGYHYSGQHAILRNKDRFIAIPSTSGTASEITAFSSSHR
jgi:alcohol dehydrogenase class IV